MKTIVTDNAQLIGHTPILEAVAIEKELHLEAKILLKLEYPTPCPCVVVCLMEDGVPCNSDPRQIEIIESVGFTAVMPCELA